MTREQERLAAQSVSTEDLEAQQVTELPERAALSLTNLNMAAPINAALALNLLSDSSYALAVAQQFAPVYQHT
jgi:hypothetical protein